MNFDYAEFKNRPFEGAVLIVTGKSGRGGGENRPYGTGS